MSGTSHLVSLSDPEGWRAALRGVDHAFAHTWESCRAMQLTTGWPTFLYVHETGDTRVVCPFAERAYGSTVDVVTPYGFSGFVGTGDRRAALAAWHCLARARSYVCGYFSLHPTLGAPCGSDDGGEPYHEAFVVDLREDEDVLFDRLSVNRKRAVLAWRRDGSPAIEDRERLTRFFVDRYADFMAARGAAGVYAFTRATLESLLGLDDVLVVGAGEGSEPSAVAVFARTRSVAEYLFGISAPGGGRHSASLLWEGIVRLRRLGVPLLDLGGGIRAGDGVAEFKRRFGATRMPLRRLRQVYDRDRFDGLCARAGADPNDWSGYFPPYRAA